MNTLTQHHLALEDMLGDIVERLDVKVALIEYKMDAIAAEHDRRTAYELARFRWNSELSRIYGFGSDIAYTLGMTRFRSHAEQAEIYSAYLAGRSLHDPSIALDLSAPWHHDFTEEH